MTQLRNKFIQLSNLKEIGNKVESEVFVRRKLDNEHQFVPPVDYFKPEEFARFGLAEQYYEDTITRIYRTYPYDGSRAEMEQWIEESTGLDQWMLENLYPRTNGYGTIGAAWGVQEFTSNGYGAPASASYEYIQTVGGPNLGFDIAGDRNTLRARELFLNSNIYDPTKKRKTNLEFNVTGAFSGSDNGVTVEFWLKKDAFNTSFTNREVLFDLWNNKTHGTSQYGRLRIELNATASAGAFRVTCLSGTTGVENISLGVGSQTTVAGVSNGDWKHYAFSFHMNEDDDLETNLYVNGLLNDTNIATSQTVNLVTGALKSNIGALITQPEGLSGPTLGHGKLLSSSLDEFRFWKVRRTAEEIGQFYNDRVGGGANTDDATTKLGVYYKFNEGITQTSSVDNLVLDFSGRVSNGTWTGYAQALTPRHTGSAILEASASNSEFKDPIVYSFHPDVSTLLTNMKMSGTVHDLSNNAALYNSYPGWILDEDENIGRLELKKLSQVLASSLDNIYIQIEYLTRIKNIEYKSDKVRQIPFLNKMLMGMDFVAPNILNESTISEYFLDKNNEDLFEKSINEIKNTIYQNLYNNLSHIYQEKGSEESFRNILRCFGVDNETIKMNLYADNQVYEFKDNVEYSNKPINAVNFYHGDSFDALVYQMTSSGNTTDTRSFISASSIPEQNDFIPFCIESEIIFPEKFKPSSRNFLNVPFVSASLFGYHNALGTDGSVLTWQLPETASVQIYAVKDRIESDDAKFVITGTIVDEFPVLTSSFFPDVYNDDKWNFSVNVRHEKYPYSNEVIGTSGSTEGNYVLEFYGVNTVLDTIPTIGVKPKSFFLTASLTNAQGRGLLRADKRLYVGAHRQDFTGALLEQTDVQVSNLRAWLNYLPTSSVLAHAKYKDNRSIKDLYKNLGYLNTNIINQDIPNIDTLLLEWNFTTNSASNDLGQFEVLDETSGSATDVAEKYAELGYIHYSYPGRGDFFNSEITGAFTNKYVPTVLQKLPESINSSDMIEIRDTNVEVKTKDSRPVSYIFAFEKSMYQNISEDMLKWFETIAEFNDLIGQPVYKYRTSYKSLEKLRELYFDKIQNEPDIDKFLNFYKWLDKSILDMLVSMMPASAKVSEAWNVVESHILERNKYEHKFPLLETKRATTGNLGVETYNWKEGAAPFDLNEERNGLWWQQKAALDTTIWSDLSSEIINNRQSFADIKNEEIQRNDKNPLTLNVEKQKVIQGGINFNEKRKPEIVLDFIRPYNGTNEIIIESGDVEKIRTGFGTDLPDGDVHPIENKNYKFKLSSDDRRVSGSNFLLSPFNLVSSSVETGYNNIVKTALSKSIGLVNLHNDQYGEKPIQGPFSEQHVGGYIHRHVGLNDGTDTEATRTERFGVEYSGDTIRIQTPTGPFSMWSRDGLAKRPLNVANIQTTTESNVHGNFQHNYEVVNSTGRTENNFYFRENLGVSASSITSSTVTSLIDYELPDRENTGSKSIIAVQFSAPGGVETSTGHLNIESEEYSPYNAMPWRNLLLRDALNQLYSSASNQFGIDVATAPVSASYHKTNRNIRYRIEKSGSSFITGALYDNGFVVHAIPRNELGYKWIGNTAVTANNIPINNKQNVPFGYSIKDVSDGIAKDIIYNAGTESDNYFVQEGFAYGPNWDYTSWKQLRVGTDFSGSRFNKKNSIISIVVDPTETADGFRPIKPYETKKFVESVVDTRYKPMIHKLKYNGQDVDLKHSYGSKLNKFAHEDLNQKSHQKIYDKTQYEKIKNLYLTDDEIDVDLLQIIYKETVYPSNKFSDLAKTRKRIEFAESGGYGTKGFDRRIDQRETFWPPSLQRTSITGSTPFINAVEYQYGRSVYPLGNNKVYYAEEDVPGVATYNMIIQKILTGSENGELNPPAYANPIANVGYSDVNMQGMFGSGSYISGALPTDNIDSTYYDNPTASLQYVYLPNVGKFTEYSWPYDVNKQAGRDPWYSSYDEYSRDVKAISQGHTILPEFKISDHIEFYINNNEGFLAKNNKFLSLQGAPLSESADQNKDPFVEEFFETYTNSDVMKHFDKIIQDHNELNAKVNRITLKCSGIKKLLPYNGFYPINRTTQLGAIFSQSLGSYISGTFSDIPASASLGLQALLQPFFAPGIVYNTIKSGVAVDWPIITGSSNKAEVDDLYGTIKGDATGVAYDAFSLYISASGAEADFNAGRDDWKEYLLTSSFDNFGGFTGKYHSRIPFETLVDLRKGLLSGSNIYLVAPDKILQSSGSARTRYPYFNWNGQKEELFEIAMHNFLSEVPNFFLQGAELTNFVSLPEKSFKTMEKGKTYYMDVVLKKTDDMFMMKSYFSGNTPSGSASDLGPYNFPMTYHGRYFGPPAHKGALPSYQPGNLKDTRAINYADPAYAPYTPPYFYGESKIRLSFTPQESRKYTIDEILSNVESSGTLLTPNTSLDENLYFAQNNTMCIDASVNLFEKTNTLISDDSSGFDQWLVQTKFESPVLNFSGSEPSADVENLVVGHSTAVSQSFLGRGMWGTYGSIPSGSTGIYLEIRESFPEIVANSTTGSNTSGSLIEVCGFQAEQKRIGKIANKKELKEAIVAIPYLERNVPYGINIAQRNFIKIDKQLYNNIKNNIDEMGETSISCMIKAMGKYYFPPFMDFSVEENNIDPFVIYIFEFSEQLDRDDLSDIWQGVMPKPAIRATKQSVTLSHPIGENEFFNGIDIPTDLRWLVFKVKRKANKNYYDSLLSQRENKDFINNVTKKIENYSYNWPYDFFSLVELAKIDAELVIGT